MYDQVKAFENNQKDMPLNKEGDVAHYIRKLHYILMRPTPVRVSGPDRAVDHVTDLSIIKQSVLFNEIKASVSAFRVAQMARVSFTDYISSI